MMETQQDLNGKKLKVFEKRTHEIVVRRVRGKPENESSITVSICTDIPTQKLADNIREFMNMRADLSMEEIIDALEEFVREHGRPDKDSEPSDT